MQLKAGVQNGNVGVVVPTECFLPVSPSPQYLHAPMVTIFSHLG